MNITINANHSSFNNNSQMIGTINENGPVQTQETEILHELRAIQEKLATAQELSERLYELEQAIRENRPSKIQSIVQQLASNFSSSLLANLASGSLLAMLGG